MVLWKKHWVAFSSFSFLKAYQHIEPLVALSYVRRYFPGATGFFGSWLGVTGTRYFSMREILSLRPLNRLWDGAMCQELGGGFNIFFCSPLLGIFPFLTNIFQRGWFNQQWRVMGFNSCGSKGWAFGKLLDRSSFSCSMWRNKWFFSKQRLIQWLCHFLFGGWRCSHQRISKEIVQKLGPGSSYTPVN